MMLRRLFLSSFVLLLLAACSRSPAPASTSASSNPAVESASTAAAAAPAAAANETPAPVTEPSEDVDFEVIPQGKPFAAAAGKIEVVEFFNYICPACNAFDPLLQRWKANLPADVQLVYVPADFRPDFVPYAAAYYAAESFGLVEKTHEAVYKAIHEQHRIPAEGDAPDDAKIAAFYANYGVGAELFLGAMRSPAVNAKLAQARAFAEQSRIPSTPTLVIDGKYRVKASAWEEKLRVADYLIAKERAAR